MTRVDCPTCWQQIGDDMALDTRDATIADLREALRVQAEAYHSLWHDMYGKPFAECPQPICQADYRRVMGAAT
jgi:hypothetical protein